MWKICPSRSFVPFLKCSSLDSGVWLDGSILLFFMKNVLIFLHTCDTLNRENITCLLTVKVKKQLLDTWINQLTPLPPWIYEIPKDLEVRITKEEGKETIVPCKSCSFASNPTDPVIGHGLLSTKWIKDFRGASGYWHPKFGEGTNLSVFLISTRKCSKSVF